MNVKKSISKIFILTGALSVLLFSSLSYGSSNAVDIAIDGKYLESKSMDQPPMLKGGRVLIPIRAISEKMGANVAWDSNNRKVTLNLKNMKIEMVIDSNIVTVNGIPKTVDVPATLTNAGRTVVPVRFISENLGYSVHWSQDNFAAHIFTKGQSPDEASEIVAKNRYIGFEYTWDDLPTNEYECIGGYLVQDKYGSDDDTYGIEQVRVNGKDMIWLEKKRYTDAKGKPHWEVKDVITLPYYSSNQYASYVLKKNEIDINEAFGLVEYDNINEVVLLYKAWYADISNEKIMPLSIDGMEVIGSINPVVTVPVKR